MRNLSDSINRSITIFQNILTTLAYARWAVNFFFLPVDAGSTSFSRSSLSSFLIIATGTMSSKLYWLNLHIAPHVNSCHIYLMLSNHAHSLLLSQLSSHHAHGTYHGTCHFLH